ncbi:5-oxoprolinase subunit PxpB [Eionea flava]
MSVVRLSENTCIILFEQTITADNFSRVKQLTEKIKNTMASDLVDIVPSYASIHITFNLLTLSGIGCQQRLEKLFASVDDVSTDVSDSKTIEIPVYYGKEVALDLPYLAEQSQLSESEVIDIHSGKTYDVYAIGFSPGFAYMGNVDSRIATPRKETPRKKIAKGSVAIADQQTAIYPSASPGGWQIIGRTPVQLIDYQRENLSELATGDHVKFTPINQQEFIALGGVLSDASSELNCNAGGSSCR